MKKQTIILILMLLMTAVLSGCVTAQATEVREFSQEYSEYALHSQDSTMWIYSRNKTEFVEAGLDAVTDHLIARYHYDGHLIELELEPLDAHQRQLVDERDMPFYQMRGNVATPENEVEVLIHGGAVHPYYAVWLRSETMTEDEIIENIRLFVDIHGSPVGFVRITQKGASDAAQSMNTGRKRNIITDFRGDFCIDAGRDTLDIAHLHENANSEFTGNWTLQRYANGYWRDTGISGSDLDPADISLAFNLSDGYYQLTMELKDGRETFYRFGVGNLSNLRAGDLPQGQYDCVVDQLWLELEDDTISLGDALNYRVRNTCEENVRFVYGTAHYFEVLLDGQWHTLSWYTAWWNTISLTAAPESELLPSFTATSYREGNDGGQAYYLFDLYPGQYRFIIPGELHAGSKLDIGVGWNRDHTLAAEFTVTE